MTAVLQNTWQPVMQWVLVLVSNWLLGCPCRNSTLTRSAQSALPRVLRYWASKAIEMLRAQALDPPLAVLQYILQPVMQPGWSAVPELKHARLHEVASPVGRARNLL